MKTCFNRKKKVKFQRQEGARNIKFIFKEKEQDIGL